MDVEHRFQGAMSEEYKLINLALPHFEELQAQVGKAVADYQNDYQVPILHAIEIGCGNGVTSHAILKARRDLFLVCLDSEEEMIQQANINLSDMVDEQRCEVIHSDALDYFKRQETGSVNIVASALTLHNMERTYRDELHHEIFRVLDSGGIFVNADKYAPQDDIQRFKALGVALDRFFDAYVPLGKYDLLRDWVLHNVADQAPDRCMKEQDTINTLRSIGFVDIELLYRSNMEAVLIALKPA
ncbi:MAG: class I SAM-dependent methyltransferase [Dehalococcoidia bacterium]